MNKYCLCCHLLIIGNSDGYCNRRVCLDIRMAAEQQKIISESGKYLVQWETMDAEIKNQRFDDKGKAEEFYVGVNVNSVSAFLLYPDGRILE